MNSPEERFGQLYPNQSIPSWAYQQLEEAPRFTELERKPAYVPLHKVVGTSHERYYKKTWMQALVNLKRDDYDAQKVKAIDYWVLNKLPPWKVRNDSVCLLYIHEDDRYYILRGNHRMVLVKLRGDESVCIKNVIHAQKAPSLPELPRVEVRVDSQPTWLEGLVFSVLARIAELFRGRD